MDFYQVMTNKSPVGPNRGYSRMQHMWMIERSIDIVAKELKMDPADVRLKNYIQPEEMPYETPSGGIYDGGDYPEMLRQALKLMDYDSLRVALLSWEPARCSVLLPKSRIKFRE